MTGADTYRGYSALFLVFALLLPLPAADNLKPDPKSIEFFEKQVRPLLIGR